MSIRSLLLAATAAATLAGPALAQTMAPGTPNNNSGSAQPMTPGAAAPGSNANSGAMNNSMGTTGATTAPGTTTGSVGSTMGTAGDALYRGQFNDMSMRASQLVDQPIYNRANERIGEINELVLDTNGQVIAAIIGVGGFLGIGEREVAVNFNAIQMTRDNSGTARMVVDMDRNRLNEAPAFQRPQGWGRS